MLFTLRQVSSLRKIRFEVRHPYGIELSVKEFWKKSNCQKYQNPSSAVRKGSQNTTGCSKLKRRACYWLGTAVISPGKPHRVRFQVNPNNSYRSSVLLLAACLQARNLPIAHARVKAPLAITVRECILSARPRRIDLSRLTPKVS